MANAGSNRRSGETLAGAVPGDCCCKTGIETHLRAYAPAKRADRSSQVDILPGFGRLRQQNRCGNFGFHSRFGGSRFQRKQIGGAQRLDPFADRGPRDRLYWRGQGIILVFLDARSLPDGENLQADICIIGGGPAGIALATTLSKAGIRVVLAESGGLEPDPATQALNDGELTGLGYRINELRLRYFGGAGNHWAGNCRPLDSIGFAARDWLPHSGWPFGRSVLDPYYERARAFCGVARQGPDLADIRAAGVATVPWSEPVETAIWQVSPARPFGAAFHSELADAAGLTVLLHANSRSARCCR